MAEIISVTALNRYVHSLLESDAVLSGLALRGEVQNFVHHRSGHFYFSLKDENCSVKAVMFRGSASKLSFEPQNGMRVIVRGKVTLYERDGAFQIYVDTLFPDGQGAAQLAFEQLKTKLEAKACFLRIEKSHYHFTLKGLVSLLLKVGRLCMTFCQLRSAAGPQQNFCLATPGYRAKRLKPSW